MEFTEIELDAALRRMRYTGLHAKNIVADIIANREPAFEPGDVVKDANGTIWLRARASNWFKFGVTAAFPHDVPVRPLRLVMADCR